MKHDELLSEADQQRMDLVHHMHHYPDGDEIIHELHHCFLFSQKNMQGNKYSLDHLVYSGKLYHVLDRESPPTLYDHANNAFQVVKKGFNQKTYFVVT